MCRYFETIKIQNAEVCNLAWHQQRFEKTLRVLGATKTVYLQDYIEARGDGVWRCKVIYDKSGVKEVTYHPYTPRKITSLKLIDSHIDYPLKALDRSEIDTLFAKRGESDEILLVKNGFVQDTSIANVAFFDGDAWVTPSTPLLEGTTRARYLHAGRLSEKKITKNDIASFSKIAFLNALVDFAIMSIEKTDKDTLIVK